MKSMNKFRFYYSKITANIIKFLGTGEQSLEAIDFLYVTEVDLSIDNGEGINEREFVRAILEDNEDSIICVTPRPQHPNNYFDSRIKYVFAHKSQPVYYLVFLILLILKIWQLDRKYQFKALVFRPGIVPLVPLILSQVLHKPIFFKTIAGYSLFEQKHRSWVRRTWTKFILPIHRAALHQMHGGDTVSKAYIEWFHFKFGINKEKLQLIPNGANINFFLPQKDNIFRTELGFNQFTKIIGYVGALASLRHLDEIIHSMLDVRDIGSVALVLIGDGPQKNSLENLVYKLGLEDIINFTGVVQYQEIPQYMNTFDVAIDLSLVPMSINGKSQYGSFSQKIPQYLSCGLPVIAWDTPDTQFIKQNQLGNLITPGDVASLSEGIKNLLSMDELDYGQLCLRARAYAETNFAAKTLVARRIEFWQSLLNNDEGDQCLK